LVLLAATVPLFAATAFRPLWWQTLIAAAIGSAVGQLVVRATRGRRVAEWSVAALAASVVVAAGAWSFIRDARHDHLSGSPLLIVSSSSASRSSLTWDDVAAIKTRIPSIDLAVPYQRKSAQLTTDEMNWNTSVVGTTPDYFDLMAMRVVAGDRFDVSAAGTVNKVVVLGGAVVTQLFGPTKNPVGEVVRINSQPFTVVGVLARQGMSKEGQDLDDVAIMPIEVYASKLDKGLGFGGVVLISARSGEDLPHVEAEVRSLLRDRHRLRPGDGDDFMIRTFSPD
jgi:putative ABC transport system permease protein